MTITDHLHPARKGKLLGLSYAASNAAAPVDRSILIFGNSFFEKVPGWASAMPMVSTVRDIRFVWLPWVDLTLAKELNPDVVIFQTCERFLQRTPQSQGAAFDPARGRLPPPRDKAARPIPPAAPAQARTAGWTSPAAVA